MNLRYFYILLFSGIFLYGNLFSQTLIENQIVEVYYIANEDDAASPFNDGIVPGTTTYRVYLDLCEGCKIREVFHSETNPFFIQSTDLIFNSSFGSTFGHNLNSAFLGTFDSSPLDSYLTFGAASTADFGLLKENDPDGSIWEGRTPPQSLTNSDSEIGTPLFEADGLISSNGETTEPAGWQTPIDLTALSNVFGTASLEQSFNGDDLSEPFFLRSSEGVSGQNGENIILLAQITTAGDLEFKFNLVIENSAGELTEVVSTEAGEGQIFSNFLFYPPQCGCTDPNFLEYDPAAGCDDGSCMTAIIFGCLNPDACNFNPDANFDVPELCCFIDSCQGLDIDILCPALSVDYLVEDEFLLFPNPARNQIYLKTPTLNQAVITIYSIEGKHIKTIQPILSEENRFEIAINDFDTGLYILMILDDYGNVVSKKFQVIN